MIDWHNPHLRYEENIALVKLCHVLGGLYIWEFVWSIGYEFSIITGRRRLTWTSPLYIGARWLTLLLIVIDFVAYDARHSTSCQATITLNFVFGTLSLLSASTLVMLRAFALWEQNKVVVAFGSTLWLTNAIIYLYCIIAFRGDDAHGLCMFKRGSHINILVLSTFITDFSILILMVSGVMRWSNTRGRSGIWKLLYTQGLAWIAIFTFAALPPVVLVFLDLNDVMDRVFLLPEIISMTVCASRMYLGLVNNTVVNPSPVGRVGDKEQGSGAQVQFKRSPAPLYDRYLNTGSLRESALHGTASYSV